MDWVGKTRKKVGSRGNTDYDIKVSVVKCGTKADPDRIGLALVLRNKAYGIALALDAKTVKRSPILPNSSRLYFLFENKSSDDIGVKLSKLPGSNSNGLAYRARFPFISKAEAQTVEGAWLGEYSIEYDKEEGAHYIERKNNK